MAISAGGLVACALSIDVGSNSAADAGVEGVGGANITVLDGSWESSRAGHAGPFDASIARESGGHPNGGGFAGAASQPSLGGSWAGTGGSPWASTDPYCIDETRRGQISPVDLYFMVSTSSSMDCPLGSAGQYCTKAPTQPFAGRTRWSALVDTIERFVADSDNDWLEIGFGFFPSACICQGKYACACSQANACGSCDPDDYRIPESEIAAQTIWTSGAVSELLDRQDRNGEVSIAASLGGALAHASDWAKAHSDRRVAVVYSTDGVPSDCSQQNDDVEAAERIAAEYADSKNIFTYVLGVGPNTETLQRIAQAGRTYRPYSADADSDAAAQLGSAFDPNRNRVWSCEYKIAAYRRGMLDYSSATVETNLGPGGTQRVAKVKSASDCSPMVGGWYFDDPSTPTTIVLCSATCEALRDAPASEYHVRVGCLSSGNAKPNGDPDGGSGGSSGSGGKGGSGGNGGSSPWGSGGSNGSGAGSTTNADSGTPGTGGVGRGYDASAPEAGLTSGGAGEGGNGGSSGGAGGTRATTPPEAGGRH